MIEKRYTGVASKGADVVANPTLQGNEDNLNSITINGVNYKVGGSGGGSEKEYYSLSASMDKDKYNNSSCYLILSNKLKHNTGYQIHFISDSGYDFFATIRTLQGSSVCEYYDIDETETLVRVNYNENGGETALLPQITITSIENVELYVESGTIYIWEL